MRYLRAIFAVGMATGAVFAAPHSIATLLPSPDGITVFDSAKNVNWLADANLAATDRFALPVCNATTDPTTCINPSGSMSYQAATAWVAAMNAANFMGHDNWQLPATPIVDEGCGFTGPQNNSFGFGCTAGALGALYYNALGFTAPNTAVAIPGNMVGPFSNFQPYLYWSQTSVNGTGYGTFSFNTGFHGSNTEPNYLYVLPMIPGKLPGTPPATGSGLQVNPGGQTVYDPVMNVTWLANSNLAATNAFGLPPCKNQGSPKICVNQDGAMNWNSADQFVTNMNTYNGTGYLGQTRWQLPPMDPSCNVLYAGASTADPFGELFYAQLGFSPGTPVIAAPDIAVGPFRHVQPYLYWSCEGAAIQDGCQTVGPAPGFEWTFSFGNGFLGTDVLKNNFYVMVYYPGAPNYQGLWWEADESGWGINFAHQGDQIFATWYTYDSSGKAWWLSMLAARTTPASNSYAGTIYANSGPPFNDYVGAGVPTAAGNGELAFSDINDGSFAYTLNGVSQTKAITRFDLGTGPEPTCIYSAATPNFAAATNYQDLWWVANGAEAGWGINFAHQGNSLFATWYTYNFDHTPLWLSALVQRQGTGNVYAGPIYQNSGPRFDAYDATEVRANPVGSATFTFADGVTSTFGYTVMVAPLPGPVTQSKQITRFPFAATGGTLCN